MCHKLGELLEIAGVWAPPLPDRVRSCLPCRAQSRALENCCPESEDAEVGFLSHAAAANGDMKCFATTP